MQTWNGGARRLKGYQADEIIGRHFSTFYPEEDVEAGVPEQILEQARSTGRHEAEGWRVRKDGSRFWADVVITALREDDGTLVGFGKVTRDLTSRQLATEQMRAGAAELRMANAELEQFRLLVTSVRDYAIFVLDVTGRIRTWNPGAERIKGYSADEVIGRHFELFYTDEARARRHPDHELQVAAHEGRFEEEGWRVRKDGTLFWANVVITALRDARGGLVGYAKVTRDLTERRKAQQLLEAIGAPSPPGSPAPAPTPHRTRIRHAGDRGPARPRRDPADRDRRGDRAHRRGRRPRRARVCTERRRGHGRRRRPAARSPSRSAWLTARSPAACASGTRSRTRSTPRPPKRR